MSSVKCFVLLRSTSKHLIRTFVRYSPIMLRKEDVQSMRLDYSSEEFFLEEHLSAKEPMGQFDAWFKEAVDSKEIVEPNAMILSTCSKDGQPSARTVLMKGYDKQGFSFFTNYESQKGRELTENPKACLLFYWAPLHRQVIIRGSAQKISADEATSYFNSRPRGSQIGASVSKQSTVISSREVLHSKEEELKKKYADESVAIPKPDYWGGFLIVPHMVEFWRGQSSRLHDRIRFRKLNPDEKVDSSLTKMGSDGWVYERLSP